VRVAAVVRDLLTYSRIESMASGAGASVTRCDEPDELPPASEVDLVVVDWGARRPEWAEQLAAWRRGPAEARLILFGPHVDLGAHADARAAGLGPMWARSRLMRDLPALIG
jgi:hypothetical protein